MRIRQRMLIMELSTAAAFIITIALFFVLLQNITTLKNIEIESQRILNKINNTNYRTSALINSRDNFNEMEFLWNKSIETYSNVLQDLTENNKLNLIGKNGKKNILQLEETWDLLMIETIEIFKIKISAISERNIKSKVGKYTLNYSSEYEKIDEILSYEDILVLNDFVNYQKFTTRDLNNYTSLIKTLIVNIQSDIESRIDFTLILVAIILIFIVIGAMITAFLYAGGLSRQVKLVEKTARQVTDGNFNVKLDIQTSDEFKSLSQNFNSFTEMLWTRLDAVRSIMKDMGEISGDLEDIKAVEKEILNLAIRNSGADAGAIFLYDEEENILRPAFVMGDFPPPYPVSASITQRPEEAFKHFSRTDIVPGDNVIGKVASSGEAVFIKDVENTNDLPQRWSNDPLHISSFMAIPLLVSNNVLGVFSLVKTEPYVYFPDLSFTNMKTFGEYTALSIDNRYKYTELKEKFELSRELSIATEIQQGLRLTKMPRFKNMQVSAFHNTAKGISGDYYDIFKISEQKTAVVLCDVAGKGIPAALVMVMIRTILRVIAHPDRDAGTMLTMLNNNISGNVGSDQYATMGILIIDTKTGELTFSNAANLPLQIYRKENGRFDNFTTEGLPVGVEADSIYPQEIVQLNPGDIAALCTDGLTEARNIHGVEFSTVTLLREIKKYSENNADEITEIIGKEMDIFLRGSTLYDDQSLLLIKYEG